MPRTSHAPLSAFDAAFLEHFATTERDRHTSRLPAEDQRREVEHRIAAFDANQERRKALTREQRIAEHGKELSSMLEKSPEVCLVLQRNQPASRPVWCRSQECLYGPCDGPGYYDIEDKYRIALFTRAQLNSEYYHVPCVECMIPLAPLAGSQLKLEDSNVWGLLVGKWIEHRGRININKIVAYIDRTAFWNERRSEVAKNFDTIDLEHATRCGADRPACGCPGKPEIPKAAVLENYVTDKSCYLWDVLCHPYESRERYFNDADPPWRIWSRMCMTTQTDRESAA